VLLSAGDLRFGYARGRRGRGDHGRGDRVIDDVSIEVAAGDVVAILGPNGSGKTTLLRLLSGAIAPLAGSVRLGGADISSIPRRALAQQIALVPQETSLAFDYSVLEIVLMGRYPHLGAFEVEGPADLASAMTALQATGTAEFADRPFRTLSGGEKQRVVIASALAQLDGGGAGANASADASARKLLVLDEPTASLDLRYQFEIGALLRRLHDASGLTILLSTHDLRFAATLCTRVVLLSAGRILAQGAPSEVLTPDLVGRLFDVAPHLAAPILATAQPKPTPGVGFPSAEGNRPPGSVSSPGGSSS
jgi:iron complex transport system ATP-binding protein